MRYVSVRPVKSRVGTKSKSEAVNVDEYQLSKTMEMATESDEAEEE